MIHTDTYINGFLIDRLRTKNMLKMLKTTKKKKKKKNLLKSQPEPSLRAFARSLGAEWIVDELSSGRVRLDVCVNDATGASVAVVPGKPEFGELFFFYRTVWNPAVMTLQLIIPAKLLLPPHNFVFNNKKNLNAADC
jgi:hypothetical protein